jgi:hypothetical protein
MQSRSEAPQASGGDQVCRSLFADSVNVIVGGGGHKTRTVGIGSALGADQIVVEGISVDEERYRSGHHEVNAGAEPSGAR